MTSIIIVGRCLLLPSFRRETEGTDCTWIQLPSNYDPRSTRKSTTRRWRTERRPITRRRFTSNQQCMVPIEQSYYVKDHYCNAHYQIASSKHTILCHWLNMLLCVRCQEKKNHSAPCCTMLHHVAPSCTMLHYVVVNFILQKFCPCKKMTNIRYGCTMLHQLMPE